MEMRCVRSIVSKTRRDRIRNITIHRNLTIHLNNITERSQLRSPFLYNSRAKRFSIKAWEGKPEGRRGRGRRRLKWEGSIKKM